jgi:hypothetical protein
MAKIITDLDSAIDYINILFESDSTSPSEGEEDYEVWTSLLNIGVNIWENEEGMMWRELFVKLADASDGDKTTVAGQSSYDCPTDFRMPASGLVWIGTGTNKTAYRVIKQEEAQLYQNDTSKWCYFLMDGSPSLEFNPNGDLSADQTINYEYYKHATKLDSATDTFEMSDPMFAVYYAISELKKDEGDTSALTIATQKLEAMKVKNMTPAWYQEDSFNDPLNDGFGI